MYIANLTTIKAINEFRDPKISRVNSAYRNVIRLIRNYFLPSDAKGAYCIVNLNNFKHLELQPTIQFMRLQLSRMCLIFFCTSQHTKCCINSLISADGPPFIRAPPIVDQYFVLSGRSPILLGPQLLFQTQDRCNFKFCFISFQ